jgi:hypothetical protein
MQKQTDRHAAVTDGEFTYVCTLLLAPSLSLAMHHTHRPRRYVPRSYNSSNLRRRPRMDHIVTHVPGRTRGPGVERRVALSRAASARHAGPGRASCWPS